MSTNTTIGDGTPIKLNLVIAVFTVVVGALCTNVYQQAVTATKLDALRVDVQALVTFRSDVQSTVNGLSRDLGVLQRTGTDKAMALADELKSLTKRVDAIEKKFDLHEAGLLKPQSSMREY